MDIIKIEKQLHNRTAKDFLAAVLSTNQSKDALIYFSNQINEQFKQNATYLASKETLSLQMITSFETAGGLVVGQTIDGDYIAGDNHQTLVIPVSLYVADIEVFPLFLLDFFKAYTAGKIHSTLLPQT